MSKQYKKGCKLAILLILGCFMIAGTFFAIKSDAEEIADTREELIQIIYEHMKNQEETIVVHYLGSDYKEFHKEFIDKILPEKIYTIDNMDSSDDFDYMFYNLEKVEIHTQSELIGNAKITLKLTWKEDKQTIKKVNQKLKEIIKSLDLKNDSNYTKVKKIHDYVIESVTYDDSLTYFTTYDALFKGKATCQGYMLLTYKLLTMAGVESRCIDGKGIGQETTESHGWNIVKLGKYWYNLDVTWDDPVIYQKDGTITEEGKEKFQYDFFLKGSKDFDERHIAHNRFKTKKFRKSHPISERNFSRQEYEEWKKNNKEKMLLEQKKQAKSIKKNAAIENKKMEKLELLSHTIGYKLEQLAQKENVPFLIEKAIFIIFLLLTLVLFFKIVKWLKK